VSRRLNQSGQVFEMCSDYQKAKPVAMLPNRKKREPIETEVYVNVEASIHALNTLFYFYLRYYRVLPINERSY